MRLHILIILLCDSRWGALAASPRLQRVDPTKDVHPKSVSESQDAEFSCIEIEALVVFDMLDLFQWLVVC